MKGVPLMPTKQASLGNNIKSKSSSQEVPIIPESIQYTSEKNVLSVFKNLDWSFINDNTTYLSHDIHPYPAKFVPQIPAQIIRLLSSHGEMIWDPFGGCGTTALESLLNDRCCLSTDINPIGSIIGKAKTTALCSEDEEELNRFIERLKYYKNNAQSLQDYFEEHNEELEREIPPIPNIGKWFSQNAICELAFLKLLMKKNISSDAAIAVAKASFSKIITSVSNQESETTYRAVEKTIKTGEVIDIYEKNLISNYAKIKKLSSSIGYRTCKFLTINVMDPIVNTSSEIKPDSIDLIVTSPPYPNAFDYHLYHRFRIFWLDEDPREMAKNEIGSHLNYQHKKSGFDKFKEEMLPVLKNCFLSLKPGRYAIFILGDAVFNGKEYDTAKEIGLLAETIGFRNIGRINRPLSETKRSVKSWARRAQSEQILLLRKPESPENITLNPVSYKLWPYEKRISDMERASLCNTDSDSFISSSAFDTNKLKKRTFYESYTINQSHFSTWQNILENGMENGAARKDPKYLTHGIHPYKGKFYPQLVRPLLNILNIAPGGIVFDPFCGSGTVALEAILNGYQSFGCDINPIAIEIAKAKTSIFKVSPYEFQKQIMLFKQELNNYDDQDYSEVFSIDAIKEIRSWFPDKVVNKMGFILQKISSVPDRRIIIFLKVLLSSIIRNISQQDPGDLRIRRRKVPITDAPVFEMFLQQLDAQYKNIMDFYRIRNKAPEKIGNATIWEGSCTDYDALRNNLGGKNVDMIITSPPYATALPYIDTNRLNMLVLDGLNASKRVPIEASMTGTREINKSTRIFYEEKIKAEQFVEIVSPTAIEIINKIYKENKDADVGFRKKNMAALIYMYFQSMSKALKMFDAITKANGYICIVIGDTKTTTGKEKVIIRTTQVIRETGSLMGWSLIKDIPISVTKENYVHSYNSITENNILIFKKQ